MKRHTITLGASTTAGGKVIRASASGYINGIQIALADDLIFCPACKSQGKIVCIGPRIPETWDGKEVALENDLCMCLCTTPPKLIANQSLRYQLVGSISDATVRASAVLRTYAHHGDDTAYGREIIGQFFSLLDENDQPVDGFRYDLYSDEAIHTKAADYLNGDTVQISDNSNLRLVTWPNVDGATRHG